MMTQAPNSKVKGQQRNYGRWHRKEKDFPPVCLILWAAKNWPNTSVWTTKGNVVKWSSSSHHHLLSFPFGVWRRLLACCSQVGLSEERHLLRQLKFEAWWLGKFCSFPHETRLFHGIEQQAFQSSVLVVLRLFLSMYFLSLFNWKVCISPTFLSHSTTSFQVV